MTNQPPLNPDALEAGAKALYNEEPWQKSTYSVESHSWDEIQEEDRQAFREEAEVAVSAYLAVSQPVVNSFDPRKLNRRGWTCGCEPGNYDSCDECQSACNELANFLNRPEMKP